MEQINKYVNSVYKHVGGNKEEIEALKYEMKNHLLQLIEELKSEGKSEEESISIAINRFGEENQIENELIGIFKFVNKKAKKALIIAGAFLLITIISGCVSIIGTDIYWKQIEARNDEIFTIMSSYSKDNIDSINKDISTVFNKSKKKLVYVAMASPLNDNFKLENIEYMYPSDFQGGACGGIGAISRQITTEKGSKNIILGIINEGGSPRYLRKIGISSFVWLGCCLISIIAWALIKVDLRIKFRH
ncbi:permease prefix domain 1-containing protein [Clostridium sp. FP1]|uniref:permease prefix domain 1-containing protein n=1 Tax=Clostridium sp. FP1 TaxID=2724076 RepID=UPI001CCB955B|nr:permease prefix domain 1-containing protein [Clostridium sp. FP1]MBZ9637826.1 permease prefix domain 1-containing protein [Clostridium sp. FP1]